MVSSKMEHLVTYEPVLSKRHVGPKSDGGYIIVDGLTYDFYLSCGIGYETVFDQEFSSLHPNLEGVAFDGTIIHIPVAGKNTTPFPITGVDYPNNPYSREYILNFWPFVSSKQ